jgi:hypothetical protein
MVNMNSRGDAKSPKGGTNKNGHQGKPAPKPKPKRPAK